LDPLAEYEVDSDPLAEYEVVPDPTYADTDPEASVLPPE
jgi:hypothetical protein